MFFDLSIPFLENDKNDPSKNKALKVSRQKAVARAMVLGYTAVAYDRPFRGVMSDSDRCKIPFFSLPTLLEVSPTLPSAVSFHRDLLGVSRSSPFRQYTRVTIAVDKYSVSSAFNSRNLLRSYDLVAIRPLDQDGFDKACQVSEVDIIALGFPLKFRLKPPMVEAAIKRGVHFEITYSNLISDVHIRRQMLSDARLLVDWTRGKNLIISSSAASVNEIRGPYDVANLSSFLLGLSMERAKAAISLNCRSLVACALRKKDYKEAIRIERILPDEQLDSKGVWFGDWTDWDPISSGEGDLPPLDDISKLFSVASKIPKHSPSIDFLSCTNGWSFKDQISSAGEDLLSLGENKTLLPCPKAPGSAAANKVPSASTNEAAEKDRLNEVPIEDRKLMAVMPLGLQISGCEGDQVSPSDVPRMFSDSEEPALSISNNEHLQNSIGNNVVSDAAGMPSSNITLKHCNFTGEGNLVSLDFNLTCVSAVDNSEPSAMCMEDIRNFDGPNVVSVATETPKFVTGLVDGISSVAGGHISSSGSETLFTMSLDKDLPKEQVLAKIVEREQKDEVLSGYEVPMSKDFVGPAPSEGREGAVPSPDDVPLEGALDEMKEQEQREDVSVNSDAPMEKVLVKMEEQSQLGSVAADGAAPYMLKSGKGRRKGKGRSLYPLPFKGLLNPMLFKKKVCQSRRSSRHF